MSLFGVRYCKLCDKEFKRKNLRLASAEFYKHLQEVHLIHKDFEYEYLVECIGGVPPKCKNPKCNNSVVMMSREKKLSEFCSPGCILAGKLTDPAFSEERSRISRDTMIKTQSSSKFKEDHKLKMNRLWSDPEYCDKMHKVLSNNTKEFWKDENKIKSLREGSRRYWELPENKARRRELHVARSLKLSAEKKRLGGFTFHEKHLKDLLVANNVEYDFQKSLKFTEEDKKIIGEHRVRMHMDFYLPDYKLNVEIDGEMHDFQEDSNRDKIVRSRGMKVVRLNNSIEEIDRFINDLILGDYRESSCDIRYPYS